MSRNGSGTYVPPTNSWSPAVSGTLATTADWTALLNDMVAALTQSVSKDGQTTMTGSLNMGGFSLTNVASAAITTITGATLTTPMINGGTLNSPLINTPTGIVKGDVGLGNVDNTSDANKPVSTATQTALNLKQDLDADLTAIAGLASNGLIARTGAGTAAVRTLTAGAGIQITNGDGVSGDPTIAVTASAGLGDVSGPASATSGNIATFSGTTGKLIQDGGKALPSGAIVGTTDTQTLSGKTLTAPESTGAIYDNGSVRGNITAMGALDVDCSAGNYFTKTINGASTFTFSNAPSSRAYAFTLELTHTSGTVTWPAAVQWPGGTAPSLTTGKTHIFVFVTDDGGTRWRGASQVNYTN